jgi:hypothetical protein
MPKRLTTYEAIKKFKVIHRDKNKLELCKQNGIDILYFSYKKILPKQYHSKIFTNIEELYKNIKTLNT